MSNTHLTIFQESLRMQNKVIWNDWKNSLNEKIIMFEEINFSDVVTYTVDNYNFIQVRFYGCQFKEVDFFSCDFRHGIFENCEFTGPRSSLEECKFQEAEFRNTNFTDTDISKSDFSSCTFINCKFNKVNFYKTSLINAVFNDCEIKDCEVFGANVWNITTTRTEQKDLRIPFGIGKRGEARKEKITIDDLELANIVFLLSANENFTRLLSEFHSRFVLILGRFGENMPRLEAIKKRLREYDYSPIVFDFQSPNALDLIEVIVFLALVSKFIIADLSEPKSVPAELQSILSNIMIPVVPILHKDSSVYGTYSYTNRYSWILPVLVFENITDLTNRFNKAIIKPANELFEQILQIKGKNMGSVDVSTIELDEE